MNTILQIAPINPIRFKQPHLRGYDFEFSRHKCYSQKFNQSDKTMFQIATDYVDFSGDVSIYLVETETGISIPITLFVYGVPNPEGTNLKFYNVIIDFSFINEGNYTIVIDGAAIENGIYIESENIEVKENHENTLLINYTNSQNDFDVIFYKFSTEFPPFFPNTSFSLRVEGTIQNFTPRSNDEIYIDQRLNPLILYSQPFRLFTLFVGNAAGLPDWMLDIVNRAFSCDDLAINTFPFGKTEGAEWEVVRTEEYPFAGMTLEIMPTESTKTGINIPEIVLSARHENGGENGTIKLDAQFIKLSESITATGNIGLYIYGEPPETPPWMLTPFSVTLSAGTNFIEVPLPAVHADDTAAIPRIQDVVFTPSSVDSRNTKVITDVELYDI